jgi:hypothetical protein
MAATTPRAALLGVVNALLCNVDATPGGRTLQLAATKRALLYTRFCFYITTSVYNFVLRWLASGGGDVVSICRAVCDELYPQCFRSAAPSIGTTTRLLHTIYDTQLFFFPKHQFIFYSCIVCAIVA